MATILWIFGFLAALAAGLGALPKLFRALVTFSRFVVNFNAAAPVLLKIGNEFSRNGGSTLKDQVVRIEEKADAAMWLAGEGLELAKAHGEVLKSQDSVLKEQNEVLAEIRSKVSELK